MITAFLYPMHFEGRIDIYVSESIPIPVVWAVKNSLAALGPVHQQARPPDREKSEQDVSGAR